MNPLKDQDLKSKYIEIKTYDVNHNEKNNYTFRYNKNDLIEVYKTDESEISIDIKNNQELLELANNILLSQSINNSIINMDKEELNKLADNIKSTLFTTIKLIKEDIPLLGLSKRLDISLSKINSKKEDNNAKTKTRKK